MGARVALVAVGVGLLITVPCQAAVLCKTQSDTVKLRDTCKRKEAQIDPVALGLQGPKGDMGDPGQQDQPGAPGAPGPQGPALVVKDANGAVVGLVIAPIAPAPVRQSSLAASRRV